MTISEAERIALVGMLLEYLTAAAKPGSELALEFFVFVEDGPVTIRPTELLQVLTTPAAESIVCPRCGMRSYHPQDIKQRYCGNCHQFHEG